jgi:hypothetical protein
VAEAAARIMSHKERCETCGEPATAYDYDQYKTFCAQHVEQPGFTVPLDDFISTHRKSHEEKP